MRTITQFLLPVLFNASWQIVLVVMFAALCAWLLRGTAAWHRHAVWVAAVGLSFCLPLVSSSRLFDPAPSPEQTPPLPVATDQAQAPALATAEISDSEVSETIPAPAPSSEVKPSPRGPSIAPIRVNGKLAQALVLLYAMFVLFRGAKLFQAWRRTKLIVRTAYFRAIPEPLQTVIAECQSTLGVSRFRILFSASVPVPMTAGVFTPLIVLPEQLLREDDRDILSSALGHELVHVARRDYVLNLLYELLYLPLSFHPAVALLRRRVRQTRELCCDELVAGKLVKPEVYARSLVRLIGSAPLAGRLAADTTIGITDADILEVRIMSLLGRTPLSGRRRAWRLIAASLLLAAPCFAAASFAFSFDLDNQEPAVNQDARTAETRELQRARAELMRKQQELKESARTNSGMQAPAREALRRVARELAAAAARVEREQATVLSREQKERLKEVAESLAQHRSQLAEMQERYKQSVTQYPDSRQYAEALDALRRTEQEIESQQQEKSKEKREKLKQKEKVVDERIEATAEKLREKELRKLEVEEREDKKKIGNNELEMRKRKEVAEERQAERSRRHAELTNLATVSMDRAIQVATSQYPGKVLACSLGRDGEGRVFYHVVIITSEGQNTSTRYVWVSALDGQILKTEKEDR